MVRILPFQGRGSGSIPGWRKSEYSLIGKTMGCNPIDIGSTPFAWIWIHTATNIIINLALTMFSSMRLVIAQEYANKAFPPTSMSA